MATAAGKIEDTEDYEPQFMDIPDMVRDKIFRLLDYDTRITSRLVCSEWRDSIDNCLQGVTLTVDDRDPVNTGLTNSMYIREVHVLSLREPGEQFFYKPRLLTAAKFHAQLPMPWFIGHVLQGCEFLNKVVLRGDYMCAQDLTYALPRNTPTQVNCPNLKTLEIIYNEPENFPYSPQGNLEPLPGQEIHEVETRNVLNRRVTNSIAVILEDGIYAVDLNRVNQVQFDAILKVVNTVDRNMSFLMGLFRSPKLELLHIQDVVFPLYGNHRYWNFSWKGQPFRDFLQYHSKTLHHVYLPSYLGHEDSAASRWGDKYPKDLLELDLLLHFRDLRQNNTVWESMFPQQNHIQELTLNLFRFPFPFYETLFWLLPDTLRKLIIRFQLRPEDLNFQLEINAVVFSRWPQLEYLHLQNVNQKWGYNELGFTNDSVLFTNFALLPTTLKILIIRRINVTTFRADCLTRFSKLIHTQIGSVLVNPGDLQNVPMIFQYLFRMRSLNSVEIYFRSKICYHDKSCREIFKAYATPRQLSEDEETDNFFKFFSEFFVAEPEPERQKVVPYKDGTGMGVLNFYPATIESEIRNIVGLRVVPKSVSNQAAFLGLFEASRNREITFKIFDSGNLYTGEYHTSVYWADLWNEKPDNMGVEFIVKKNRTQQQKLQRYLDQDTVICGCCANPIYREDNLLDDSEVE